MRRISHGSFRPILRIFLQLEVSLAVRSGKTDLLVYFGWRLIEIKRLAHIILHGRGATADLTSRLFLFGVTEKVLILEEPKAVRIFLVFILAFVSMQQIVQSRATISITDRVMSPQIQLIITHLT